MLEMNNMMWDSLKNFRVSISRCNCSDKIDLLRHGADKEGLKISADGFAAVEDIFNLPMFKQAERYTVGDILLLHIYVIYL